MVFTRVCAPATHSVDTRYAAICSTSNALLFSAVQGGKKEQNKKEHRGREKPLADSRRENPVRLRIATKTTAVGLSPSHILSSRKNAPLGRKESQLNRRKEKRSVGVLQPLYVCFAYRILYKKPTVSSLETFRSAAAYSVIYWKESLWEPSAPLQTPPGAARMECLSRNRSRLAPY